MVNIDSQLDKVYRHLRDKSLVRSVRKHLDLGNLERPALNVLDSMPWAGALT